MRIDPEQRTLQGLTSLLAFIGLNLLYLLVCLPIVTVPAATSALYEVTIRYSDDEQGHPLADFLPVFARGFARSSLVALPLLPPAVLLAFSGVFWLNSPSLVGGGAGVLALLGAAYLLAAFLYGMALVARFEAGAGRTIRNALLLPAAEPLRTIGLLVIPVTLVCLTILFPAFIVVLLTIGCSVGAYGSAFLFRGAFARHA